MVPIPFSSFCHVFGGCFVLFFGVAFLLQLISFLFFLYLKGNFSLIILVNLIRLFSFTEEDNGEEKEIKIKSIT